MLSQKNAFRSNSYPKKLNKSIDQIFHHVLGVLGSFEVLKSLRFVTFRSFRRFKKFLEAFKSF